MKYNKDSNFLKIENNVKTLGCKVNQVESEKISKNIFKYDLDNFFVINTCTLTSKTDSKCRNLINRIIREKLAEENNFLIITGCLVERAYQEIYAQYINPTDRIISNRIILVRNIDKIKINNLLNKLSILKMFCNEEIFINEIKDLIKKFNNIDLILENLELLINSFSNHICDKSKIVDKLENFKNKSRAFLKIQDGCDSFCHYCIVPFVRNIKWSLPFEELKKEVQTIIDEGYKEIVLTGTRIGFYEGASADGKNIKFSDVLSEISKNKELKRIRISSIEPSEITDDLIEILKNNSNKNICEHLHIAIQSGDDEILNKMNRRYNVDFLRELFKKLRTNIKDIRITIDLIVGYLSESDENFKNTLRLLKELEIDGIHIFPFSVREGTFAYEMLKKDKGLKIPTHILEKRKKILLDLNVELTKKSLEKFQGKEMDIFLESSEEEKDFISGYTRNYIKVFVSKKRLNKIFLEYNGIENKNNKNFKYEHFFKLELKQIEINEKGQVFFRES
jgi:threonylcarbamoyladenosine tRNA methylthiotransferase MtaB